MYCSPASMAPPSHNASVKRFGIKTGAGMKTTPVSRLYSTGPSRLETSKTEEKQEKVSVEKISFKDKAANMWKAYGKVAIATYLGVYITTLSSMFLALNYDIFSASTFGLDPASAIAKVKITE